MQSGEYCSRALELPGGNVTVAETEKIVGMNEPGEGPELGRWSWEACLYPDPHAQDLKVGSCL